MMNLKQIFIVALSLLLVLSCKKECETPVDPIPSNESEIYFPPISNADWDAVSPESLNWNTTAVTELCDFMEASGTRAFIILKDGEIVVEKYWGMDLLNIGAFGDSTNWYWASADKTLTAVVVGKAQDEGFLNIEDKSSDHLGIGWTNMTLEQEDQILLRHQLSMTTGLEYANIDLFCTEASCLTYKADAGEQWYYHNAPYLLLKDVIENATSSSINEYTASSVGDLIGMEGAWLTVDSVSLYFSTARGAARFGLLLSNDCNWDGTAVLSNTEYIQAMKNPSQTLNPAYGYLTWLNGSETIIYPVLPFPFNSSLAPPAPADLYGALGKNGQFIDVVPSEGLVVVRLGDNPDQSLVPLDYHDEMWEKIMGRSSVT